MKKLSTCACVFLFLITLAGCGLVTDGVNYTDLTTPRYCRINNTVTYPPPEAIKVISYNIKFSEKADKAAELLSIDQYLCDADIIFLQEMDPLGVEEIAKKLRYNYIYYPAVRHPLSNRDFGNAILTKWPIVYDQKIILPHLDPDNLQRAVVGAGIKIGDAHVMAYSIHMSIWLKPEERRDQLNTLLANVPKQFSHVILGGDFNTYTKFNRRTIFETLNGAGFELATAPVQWTYKHWYFLNKKSLVDYIFVKNLKMVEAGMVKNRQASDHLPIWTRVKIGEAESAKKNSPNRI